MNKTERLLNELRSVRLYNIYSLKLIPENNYTNYGPGKEFLTAYKAVGIIPLEAKTILYLAGESTTVDNIAMQFDDKYEYEKIKKLIANEPYAYYDDKMMIVGVFNRGLSRGFNDMYEIMDIIKKILIGERGWYYFKPTEIKGEWLEYE